MYKTILGIFSAMLLSSNLTANSDIGNQLEGTTIIQELVKGIKNEIKLPMVIDEYSTLNKVTAISDKEILYSYSIKGSSIDNLIKENNLKHSRKQFIKIFQIKTKEAIAEANCSNSDILQLLEKGLLLTNDYTNSESNNKSLMNFTITNQDCKNLGNDAH